MDNEHIHAPGVNVFARFKARPRQEDRVRNALLAMVEPTVQENASVGYALHASNDDTDRTLRRPSATPGALPTAPGRGSRRRMT